MYQKRFTKIIVIKEAVIQLEMWYNPSCRLPNSGCRYEKLSLLFQINLTPTLVRTVLCTCRLVKIETGFRKNMRISVDIVPVNFSIAVGRFFLPTVILNQILLACDVDESSKFFISKERRRPSVAILDKDLTSLACSQSTHSIYWCMHISQLWNCFRWRKLWALFR